MADLSRKTATIYINHQPAEDALIALQKQADGLQTKIKAGEESGKKMVNEIAKLNKVQDDIAKVQKQIDSGLRPSFNQVQTTVSKLRNELKKMSEDAPGYADKFKAYQKASLELQRLGDSVNKVNAQQSKLGDFFSGASGALALGGIIGGAAAAGQAIVGFFSDAVSEAVAAEEASARLAATLDNLGKADAFDRITAQSDALAESLGYLDNDDINGVFEKLLTYGKLTEAQMSQLAPIILDFSAKTRTSLPEATDTIVKALEGNGKALKTFGINIKDAGTEEERFGVITTELAGKVEGAAEAFKGTFAGSLATTKQDVANLKEEIGTGLLPVLKFLLSGVSAAIQVFSDLKAQIGDTIDQMIHFRTNAEQTAKNLEQSNADFQKGYVAEVANNFAQKSLEEQQRLHAGYLANAIDFNKKYKKILAEQTDLTEEQRIEIRNQMNRKTAEFNAINEVYINAMNEKGQAQRAAAEKNAEEQKKKDEELAKKRSEQQKRQMEIDKQKAKQAMEKLQQELDNLDKSLKAESDKLFKTSLQVQFEQIQTLYEQRIAKYKEGLAAGLKTQEEYNVDSIEAERVRLQSLINLNYQTTIPLPQTGPAKGAGITAGAGPSAGARGAAAGSDQLPAKGPGFSIDPNESVLQVFNLEQYYAQAQGVIDVASSTFDIVQSFNAAADARDQERLDKRIAQGEEEKNRAKGLLDKKLIDQNEYERRSRAADEKTRREAAKLKKQQFERDKKAQVISATIMGAQAVLSALTLQPFYVGLVMAAIATAKTIVEINKIKSAKPPEFARGGVLDGPSHSQGGMPVMDPRSGRKVAELEGGEPILSKKTYRNNRAIIDRLLFSSMHNNGAPIQPAWQTQPYYGMNYATLNRTANNVRRFERGGVFAGDSTASDSGIDMADLAGTLRDIRGYVSTPPKAVVVLSEINAAQEVQNDIRNETVMSRK